MTNRTTATTAVTTTRSNAPLVQCQRPTRRRMTNGELRYRELEAGRAIRAQQRLEAREAQNIRVAIILVAILATLAASGLLAEKVLWVIMMAFSAC